MHSLCYDCCFRSCLLLSFEHAFAPLDGVVMYPPLSGINRGGALLNYVFSINKIFLRECRRNSCWRRCWIKTINRDFPRHSPAVPWIKLGKGPLKNNQTPQLIFSSLIFSQKMHCAEIPSSQIHYCFALGRVFQRASHITSYHVGMAAWRTSVSCVFVFVCFRVSIES